MIIRRKAHPRAVGSWRLDIELLSVVNDVEMTALCVSWQVVLSLSHVDGVAESDQERRDGRCYMVRR